MRIAVILFLFVVSVFVRCKSIEPAGPLLEQEDPVEGMVFLTFVMRSDSTAAPGFELTGKTIVRQKLKSDPVHSTALNRVRITQLTKAGRELSEIVLDHPLTKRVEFADDQGNFQSREVNLNDAGFFVRVTLYRQTEYIRVAEERMGKIVHTKTFNLRQ